MEQRILQAELEIFRQSGTKQSMMSDAPDETQKRQVFGFDLEDAKACFTAEQKGDCLMGRVEASLRVEPFRENDGFAYAEALSLSVTLSHKPLRMTALYLHRDWWTRPAFVTNWEELPPRTQCVYLDYGDCFGCLLLLSGESYKAQAAGGKKDVLRIGLTAYMAGEMSLCEPVFVLAEADSPYRAIEIACRMAAGETGALLTGQKELPEMFDYLGWCSWDAFYREISEEKVREKAGELAQKDVPVRWLLMDDGWQSVREDRMYDLAPEREKFPDGFLAMAADLKADGRIRWLGVWHSLGGYWGGIEPGSAAAQAQREHLYLTRSGKLLPAPCAGKGYGFYRDWYAYLRSEGIDFVKVDGQSAIKNHYANDQPVCRAARETHRALEGAVGAYMGGRLINCMGMAMENILGRQGSALSRNSDDFVPDNPEGFAEHLLQNAYNAPYHGQFYYCDWDMFWSCHPDAQKHAVLRAISGGPVYVSDRIGETSREVLAPLALGDGKLLRMDRAAMPAPDCLFADPQKEGVVKLTNVADCGQEGKKGAAIALYNLGKEEKSVSFGAGDVFDLPKGAYVCVDVLQRKAVGLLQEGERVPAVLPAEGFLLYVFVPCAKGFAALGLLDKYIGFAALAQVKPFAGGFMAVTKEAGTFGFWTGRSVQKVWCNGIDKTRELERDGQFYQIRGQGRGSMVVQVWLEEEEEHSYV